MYGFNVCVCIFTICTVRGYTCVYGHIEKKKGKKISRVTRYRWSTMDLCRESMNDLDHYYTQNNWGTRLGNCCRNELVIVFLKLEIFSNLILYKII